MEESETLFARGEPLAIEQYGQTIGHYIPIRIQGNFDFEQQDRAAGRAALDHLGEVVADILNRTGMTEDELVAALTDNDEG